MASLAIRNLFHDRVRLAVTLTGIVFAIVLIVIQLGLFIGFQRTTSSYIDHAGADLWVTAAGIPSIDLAVPIKERKRHQLLAVEGIAEAQNIIVAFATWKRADGRKESIEVIGFDPDTSLGGPWDLVEGSLEALKTPDAVILDEFYKDKLGVKAIGDEVEISDRRARVVGFTRGIRSFTTSPHVFTRYRNAMRYTALADDESVFVLIKAKPGAAIEDLRGRIASRVPDLAVYTTPEFAKMTQDYWLYTTGAGITVLIAAALGLIVGLVVVAQTIYASTMDHIREFGTLKAMGASNGYIYRVLIQQAIVSGVIGYSLAMLIAVPVVNASESGGARIIMPWELSLAMLFVSVFMCIAASAVSIRKVTTIDPAMVFKG